MEQLLRIADITTCLGISSRTLRYYEAEGLLHAVQKDGKGRRFYSAEEVLRLLTLIKLRDSGLNIAALKQYVAGNADFAAETALRTARISELSVNAALLSPYYAKSGLYTVEPKVLEGGCFFKRTLRVSDTADLQEKLGALYMDAIRKGFSLSEELPHLMSFEGDVFIRDFLATFYIPVSGGQPLSEVFPPLNCVATYHRGSLETLPIAYEALDRYCAAYDTPRVAPVLLCNLEGYNKTADPSRFLTAVFYPVESVKGLERTTLMVS